MSTPQPVRIRHGEQKILFFVRVQYVIALNFARKYIAKRIEKSDSNETETRWKQLF